MIFRIFVVEIKFLYEKIHILNSYAKYAKIFNICKQFCQKKVIKQYSNHPNSVSEKSRIFAIHLIVSIYLRETNLLWNSN